MEKIYCCIECGYSVKKTEIEFDNNGIFQSSHRFQKTDGNLSFPSYSTQNNCCDSFMDTQWVICYKCGAIESLGDGYGGYGLCENCYKKY